MYAESLTEIALPLKKALGSESLELVFRAASSHHQPKIHKIYLYIQISNGDSKKFYGRRSFREAGIHKGYYKKIAPHDA
ncbi:hypothetical protein ARMGADRAFT_933914 [Armillaria gallica]|uniref:Uncharacterized protein n=1 Tax=Armillaria gallica TaxID=47427 RepID=A0A2H3DNW3_ARMGA|nr:hypothetical protein ARMGADRAFT_933914 [Armillaria gallica]